MASVSTQSPRSPPSRTAPPTFLDPLQLPAEIELLLACARVEPSAAARSRIAELAAAPIDWRRLVDLAFEQGVLPLVHRNLRRIDSVPPRVRAELRERFRSNAVHSQVLTEEVVELSKRLEEVGVECLPFKGPTLARAAYGDVAYRQFGDLDVLIRREDLEPARLLLEQRGYALRLRPDQLERRLQHDYNFPFLNAERRLLLELHWAITPRAWSFPTEPLWPRRAPLELAGQSIWTLHPEDLLLVLAVHGSKHFWSHLLWVCDVAELLRAHPEIHWPRVATRAKNLGCRRMLRLALLLAHDLLEAPIPATLHGALARDKVAQRLAMEAREQIALGAPQPLGDRNVRYLLLMDRVRDRLHFALIRLARFKPNARDRQFIRLPRGLGFLYYLIRPVRILLSEELNPAIRLHRLGGNLMKYLLPVFDRFHLSRPSELKRQRKPRPDDTGPS